MHEITFAALHNYAAYDAIMIPTTLRNGELLAQADAYLDTGASVCIFKPSYADLLELEIEAGTPLTLSTATGTFTAYGHAITLETLGLEFETTVYFAALEGLPRNVLGRLGWLDQVRVGIIEHDSKLYVSRYDTE